MYYVTMTDKFMSGWGMAKNKTNKYVIECETLQEALTIERNAEKRSEMKYINRTRKMPYYTPSKYVVSLEKYQNLGEMWKK